MRWRRWTSVEATVRGSIIVPVVGRSYSSFGRGGAVWESRAGELKVEETMAVMSTSRYGKDYESTSSGELLGFTMHFRTRKKTGNSYRQSHRRKYHEETRPQKQGDGVVQRTRNPGGRYRGKHPEHSRSLHKQDTGETRRSTSSGHVTICTWEATGQSVA